ncbi:hypothetical protein NB311A_20036 [Nitrobacter sp. Nb-311A]|nr:hypothetical protein NB311A_20036 [Nitrobacter sp. Nb-311A]
MSAVITANPIHETNGTRTEIDDSLLIGCSKNPTCLEIGFILESVELQIVQKRAGIMRIGSIYYNAEELRRPRKTQDDISIRT